MIWWLVSLDKEGVAKGCVEEAMEPNAPRTYRVEAADRETAVGIAQGRFRAYQTNKAAGIRRSLRKSGLCRCGATLPSGYEFVRCERCRKATVQYGQAYRQRKLAEKRQRQEEERLSGTPSAREATRAETLLEVQSAWQDAPSNGRFTAWLRQRLEAITARVDDTKECKG